MRIEDSQVDVSGAHTGQPLEPVAGRKARAGDWQGAILIFVLVTCCLLPVFLVALGDWFAAVTLRSPIPRWATVLAVSVAGLAVALWWSRRARALDERRSRGSE